MPKIDAPTVAEHRARQESALLNAARDLLLAEGVYAVTPAAVGAVVGLARSSVYKYFGSTEEILAKLAESTFAEWARHVNRSVDAGLPPAARIDAYVTATLELAAAGEHRIATALSGVELGEECRHRIAELHDELAAPLRDALRDANDPDPDITAALVRGALDGAIQLIDAGAAAGEVVPRTMTFLRHAVGLPHRRPQPQQ